VKLNPLAIARVVAKALANKDALEARAKALADTPVSGRDDSGQVVAHLDVNTGRVTRITDAAGAPLASPELVESIRVATNRALDGADALWANEANEDPGELGLE
jgi:hypothetical protein